MLPKQVIETSIYETTGKLSPLRKRLQFVRLIMVTILMLCFTTTLPSAAAPGTNSFTGSASVPDLVTFTTTGSMNIGCYDTTATLLNNGKVLVTGEIKDSSFAGAELYDPTTGSWSITGSMNVGHYHPTVTLLNNGKVLATGGYNSGSYLVSAELYDPSTGIWSTTGSMNVARADHTATLLNNGKVLVAGGWNGSNPLASTELYDPATETWSITGSLNVGRARPSATLLNNSQVLVTGGASAPDGESFANTEMYDPTTGTWSTTGIMHDARVLHTATLLNNGKVLVAGGWNGSYPLASTELYDPVTGTWSITGILNDAREWHTATLLNNGKVLVTGGVNSLSSVELYDPVAGTWSNAGNMNVIHFDPIAILLNNGKVLIAGGGNSLLSAELGTLIPVGNTFSGTLTLPSGWLNSTTISVQFVGTLSGAAINAGALSNDNNAWGSWIAATSGVTATTTWNVSGEGANKPVYLRLRDINDQKVTVVMGTVNVDLTKPTSTMTALPAMSPANIPLAWSGSDALSGLSTYDVQVRAGTGGAWTDVLSNTTNTSTIYTGSNGITYYFRARARDVAGNVEDWPPDYETFTFTYWSVFLPLILK